MTSYKTKFILRKLPMDKEEADHLSNEITGSFGSEGWELISTAIVPILAVPLSCCSPYRRRTQADGWGRWG